MKFQPDWLVLYDVPFDESIYNKDDRKITKPMLVLANLDGWVFLLTEHGFKWAFSMSMLIEQVAP